MNLVQGSVKTDFTGAFGNHFDTFSDGVNITVFKEPIQVIGTPIDDNYAGYENSNPSITYIPVSGVFPAIKVFKKGGDDSYSIQTKVRNPEQIIRIKVKPDARDYIENGKNDCIMLNGNKYNDISTSDTQNFFGLVYYYYDLQKTD